MKAHLTVDKKQSAKFEADTSDILEQKHLQQEEMLKSRKQFRDWLEQNNFPSSKGFGNANEGYVFSRKSTTVNDLNISLIPEEKVDPNTSEKLGFEIGRMIDRPSELTDNDFDKVRSGSLRGIYHEGIYLHTKEQSYAIHQLERVLLPGGSFGFLAIVPLEKFACVTRKSLKLLWGSPVVKSNLRKLCERSHLTIEMLSEKRVVISPKVWMKIYDLMKKEPQRWKSVFKNSSLPTEETPMPSYLSARVDLTAVWILGSKPL
mmetsp:Transcript_25147/g.28749  ORF Transcript_25147/g.28749 Transcript_25147/m.28749 type:complete len:261 (+) Transcript_25147:1527-2309(+)